MNAITTILEEINDNDLEVAIRELIELDETGILPSGVIRFISAMIAKQIDIPTNHANSIVTSYVYRTAAKKWADEYRKNVLTQSHN